MQDQSRVNSERGKGEAVRESRNRLRPVVRMYAVLLACSKLLARRIDRVKEITNRTDLQTGYEFGNTRESAQSIAGQYIARSWRRRTGFQVDSCSTNTQSETGLDLSFLDGCYGEKAHRIRIEFWVYSISISMLYRVTVLVGA
jgi:hypothetical protein